MRGLRVLQMRDHGLVSASFPTLRNLTMLDLGENPNLAQLTTEFSQGLENLQYLWLDRCQIDFAETTQTSPFDHMASLTALYLTDNKIRRYSPALFVWSIHRNFIPIRFHRYSFPPRLLANNAKLWALDLSRNLMTTWPVQDNDSAPLPQMDLSLARNRITYLPNGFYDQFKHLWGLDLGDNAFICTCDLVRPNFLGFDSPEGHLGFFSKSTIVFFLKEEVLFFNIRQLIFHYFFLFILPIFYILSCWKESFPRGTGILGSIRLS